MSSAPPQIFSRRKAAAKFARAADRRSATAPPFLAEVLAEDVLDRLGFIRLTPEKALVVGDLSGTIPAHFADNGATVATGQLGLFAEEQPRDTAGFDLLVHLLGLGHVNDLPGALIHARAALAEDGLFLAAFPGAGSLPTLRQIAMAADGDRASPRMHPLIETQAAAGLLQRAGFKKQVVDSYPLNLRYGRFETLVEDLRDHGLTRALTLPSPPWTRAGLARAKAKFDDLRDDEGKVPETIEILVMSGWR